MSGGGRQRRATTGRWWRSARDATARAATADETHPFDGGFAAGGFDGPAFAGAVAGARLRTSTLGSFHGPVTRYVRAASWPSGFFSTELAAAPIAAPTGPPAIAPATASRLPVRGITSTVWSKVCACRSAAPRISICAAG